MATNDFPASPSVTVTTTTTTQVEDPNPPGLPSTAGLGGVRISPNDFRQAAALLLGPPLVVEGRDPPAGADPPPAWGVEVSNEARTRWSGELKRYAGRDGGAIVVERTWVGAEKAYRLTRVGADGGELGHEDIPTALGPAAICARIVAAGATLARGGA